MDLLGKEFTSVEFGKDKFLNWDNGTYPKTLGKTGIVKNIHDTYSQYVCIRFEDIKNYGITLELHWPIEIVMNQILDKERLDPVYLDNIYKEIFKAIKVIQHSEPYNGRAYTNYDTKEVEIQYQDDGKTLKIFLK